MGNTFFSLFADIASVGTCEIQSRICRRCSDESKSALRRKAVLAQALSIAECSGIDAITFGLIAQQSGISKSGVVAHFRRREKLVIEMLDLYHAKFKQEVLYPSCMKPQGLPRLETMFTLWTRRLSMKPSANCLYLCGAVVRCSHRDAVLEKLQNIASEWKEEWRRCVEESVRLGDLRKDTDPLQFVCEVYGLVLGLHHDLRLLKMLSSVELAKCGFDRLIDRFQTLHQDGMTGMGAPCRWESSCATSYDSPTTQPSHCPSPARGR